MNWARAWLIGFALAVSGLGSPPQDVDSVKIISISPATVAPLRVGEKVTVRVEVECNLVSADSGRVTLVIQEGEAGHAPIANVNKDLRKGKTRFVLSKVIKVPDAKALRVFTPLSTQARASTSIVDSRSYKIERSGSQGVSPPEPGMDSVKIISISPNTDIALRVGEMVTLKVEVEYNLSSADSGEVLLAVQQDESSSPPIAKVVEVVVKGKARLVLNADIIVPDTKAVLVFIPLSVAGAGATHVVEKRSYNVTKN